MTEKFGIPRRDRRPVPKNIEKPRVSTTFQSYQSLAMGIASAALRRTSGECRFECSPEREMNHAELYGSFKSARQRRRLGK